MLPDVLCDGLDVVFCGTAASAASGRAMAYYAGRGNKFWRTLFAVGLTPRLLEPAEYPLLPVFGIGLTDIVKGQSGADAQIDFGLGSAGRVRASVEAHQPRFLAFNGKRAAREFLGGGEVAYGPREELVGMTRVWVRPSSAGLASGYWDIGPWAGLADEIRSSRGESGGVA